MRPKFVQSLNSSESKKYLACICDLYHSRMQSGFSLVELIVATGIVSLLATVAIPSYVSFTKNRNGSAALTALINLSTQMEKNYLDQRNYGVGNACAATSIGVADYSFSCSTTGQDYTWIASSGDNKYEFSIDQNGLKKTLKYSGATLTNKNCWLLGNKDTCY